MATVPQPLEREAADRLKPGDFGLLVIPPEAHTYHGFLDWVLSGTLPEKLRVTFLAGEVMLDMTEENIDTHISVKSAVYRTLLNLVADDDFGHLYTDGVLLGNESARVSNNPDGVAVRWSTFEAGRVQFVERGGDRRAIEGSPDWVLEIVSTSSVGKDTLRLLEAYHRAGVAEYWVIDARGEEVRFQIFDWQPGGYAEAPERAGWSSSKVFQREFRLTRDRDRVGAWTYSLEARQHGPKKTRKKS